jgi:hypothetical protein
MPEINLAVGFLATRLWPGLARELIRVRGHVNARADEAHAFHLQSQTLLDGIVTAEANVSTSADNSMPWDSHSGRGMKRPSHLPGGTGISGCGGHLSVGGHLAARDLSHSDSKMI